MCLPPGNQTIVVVKVRRLRFTLSDTFFTELLILYGNTDFFTELPILYGTTVSLRNYSFFTELRFLYGTKVSLR